MSEDEYRQTEFNSSWATLERVDGLVQAAHKCKLLLFPDRDNNKLYYDSLRRIYVEVHPKLKKDERDICAGYNTIINMIKSKYSGVYEWDYIQTPTNATKEQPNKRYLLLWSELMPEIESYELYLMECLDRHGMLMTDKQKIDITDF